MSNIAQTEQIIIKIIYGSTCRHGNTASEKGDREFKKSKGEQMRGLGERKGREKWCNDHMISKIKEKRF